MNRKSLFIAGTLLVAGLVGEAAQAHQWGCWIQADRNIRIRNAAGTQGSAAINDWHNMTILNFSYVSSGEEIYVFNANSGATGWAGLATITNYSGCTIYRATAQVNTYYYSSTSTAARGIHCQEVGHGFGLDHSNDGGCMGAGYWYSVTNAYRPVSHNVSDVGSMYANRVAAPEASEGHEHGESLRFHANWYHNPRTLRETAKIATEIVTARVVDISDGDDIVNQHEAGVQRIPTQRVTFDVTRARKGSLGVNETFVLFQNGNAENRFDEDPSYKKGHAYLLFLTPRADGTYLVVSPNGRYEISKKGLVPAAKQGFGVELAGASLEGVLSDVAQSLAEGGEGDDQQVSEQQ